MRNADLTTARLAAEDAIRTELDQALPTIDLMQHYLGTEATQPDSTLDASLSALAGMLRRARASVEQLQDTGGQLVQAA